MNDKKLTIYDIKKLTKETAPYFFSRDTMRFFGQIMKDFKVSLLNDGRYKISAPAKSHFPFSQSGDNWEYKHETIRYFNPKNNQLESK